MTKAYIVTESPRHQEILQATLPSDLLQGITFIKNESKYGAEALTRSILSSHQIPVVLVINADTSSESAISTYQQNLELLTHSVTINTPFKLLQAIPTIETVFLQDRTWVEQWIGRSLSDLEWKLGQKHPQDLLQESSKNIEEFVKFTLKNLTDERLQTLRQHPLIQEIVNFLATQVHHTNPALAS
ncbi:MAG: hypothetical protein AAGI69_20340 [Cyanobacteria bacterium P01_H01_bin.21]